MVSVSIGALPYLDCVGAGPRQFMERVRAHKRWSLDPSRPAWLTYQPILAGLRRAGNAPDPRAELERVVARAKGWQVSAFQEIIDGYLRWLPADANGVPVQRAQWVAGGLTVNLQLGSNISLLGLRAATGTPAVIMPYVKTPELAKEKAEVMLWMMVCKLGELLPGATPIVLDVRRAKAFRLPRKVDGDALDACLQGEAARYVAHWSAAA